MRRILNKITKYLFIFLILMLGSCSDMFHEKKFAIEGYENDISAFGNKKRREKVVYEDGNLKIKYYCLIIYKEGESNSLLSISKKSGNDIRIMNLKWLHIYKGINLRNEYLDDDSINDNRKAPYVILKNEKGVCYDFYTNKKSSDFKYGDIIKVVVKLKYKVNDEIKEINESVNIVCHKRRKIFEMP